MNAYTTDRLREVLDDLGVQSGDVLFVHSTLFVLGRLRGVPIREIPAALVETLRGHLGPEGTLVVPTFNFGFCRGKPFDRQRTPSEKMGPLAETVRQLPESVRSPHPIQSVAAVGRDAHEICAGDTPSAFDEGSPFGYLVEVNAKHLELGGDTISLSHYAEQAADVPYRFWKSFTGPYIDSEVEEQRTYKMFARDLDLAPMPYFDNVLEPMREAGLVAKAPLGGGHVRVFGFRDFIDQAMRQLRRDPYALVKDPDRIRPHYE